MLDPKKPEFGVEKGIWYPLIWRILDTHKYWSISNWLPKGSALAIDIYIGIWWILELVFIFFGFRVFNWTGTGAFILFLFPLYRFFDLSFVLVSILIKRKLKLEETWKSANRIVFLVIMNALEIILIFAFFYYIFGINFPEAACISPKLKNMFDALYFSVVTGSTLGYGTPAPVGWLSKLLAMIETLTFVLIVIALISFAVGVRRVKTKFD